MILVLVFLLVCEWVLFPAGVLLFPEIQPVMSNCMCSMCSIHVLDLI